MKIVFIARHPEFRLLREWAEGRARRALSRFSSFMPSVRIELCDINGPRGGVDKRCQIEVNARRTGTLVAHAIGATWRTALDRALSRIASSLGKRTKRDPFRRRGRFARIPLFDADVFRSRS